VKSSSFFFHSCPSGGSGCILLLSLYGNLGAPVGWFSPVGLLFSAGGFTFHSFPLCACIPWCQVNGRAGFEGLLLGGGDRRWDATSATPIPPLTVEGGTKGLMNQHSTAQALV
ncbi:unnamed protein product, partial [Discosporangium mesarthrocarpum]